MPIDPVFAVLDADTNRVISAEEIANASTALLKLDKNGDGQLTQDELCPQKPAAAPAGGPPHRVSPLLAAMDADGDGLLSPAEIANAPAALSALDKNGDGQLTPDELMPPRRGGPHGAGGPDEGPAHGPGPLNEGQN
jgi:Ca2+-binding EF-hand superfamily protein